jgi:EAL domain-containing protein (putative c-di-GMP-specific phosphodiesterase class I)
LIATHFGNLLDRVFEPDALTARFQPIFEIQGGAMRRVEAVEGLVRGPKGTNLERADVLFEYVRRKRQQGPVDKLAVMTVLAAARTVPADCLVTVNVHATTLGQEPGFAAFVRDTAAMSGISLARLVIEVVEHMRLWESTIFLRTLDELRRDGVRVAMDDVGIGESNLERIVDCRPDYLKIDRYFVSRSTGDRYRRAAIEAVVLLADRIGATVVAEGVETAAELDTVCGLGIGLAQGNGLCSARPLSEIFVREGEPALTATAPLPAGT